MARRLFSKLMCAKEERNGLPRTDQGLSTAKPRSSHVMFGEHHGSGTHILDTYISIDPPFFQLLPLSQFTPYP